MNKSRDLVEDYQVGDAVVVEYRNVIGKFLRISQVIKVTPKQVVIVSGRRFWRDTGKEVGGDSRLLGKNPSLIRKIRRTEAARKLRECIQQHTKSMNVLELASLLDYIIEKSLLTHNNRK